METLTLLSFTECFWYVIFPVSRQVRFEVWDRDNKWDDNRLGVVSIIPERGINVEKQLSLKHGTLFVFITAVCGPNLQGQVCEHYAPAPGSEQLLTYSQLFQGWNHTCAEETYGMQRDTTEL